MLPLVPISDLPRRLHSVRIQARIVRIWAAKAPHSPAIWHYGALLLDAFGNAIEARIPREHHQRLSRLLEEGRTCEIARFSVKNAPAQYHVVQGSHIVSFTRQTTVTPLASSSLNIPMHYFQFERLDSVGSDIKDTNRVIDVIGRIAGFSPVRDENEEDQRKPAQIMYIADERGYMLEVTLWRQFLSIFNSADLHEQSKTAPVIVICAAVQVNEWQEAYNVKAISATKFYLDQTIPEIKQFLASLPPNLLPIVLNTEGPPYDGVAVVNPVEQIEQPGPATITISEFLAIPVDTYSDTLYKCVATIVDLNNRYEWWYEACKKYMSKLKDQYCYRCAMHRDDFMNWYKLLLQVKDETGTAEFTALGNIAKVMVGADVNAMVKAQERTKDDAPQKVLAVIGKAYLFTVLPKESTKFAGVRMNTIVHVDAVPATSSPFLAINDAADSGTSRTQHEQSHGKEVPDEICFDAGNQSGNYPQRFPSSTPPPTDQTNTPISTAKSASADDKSKQPIMQPQDQSKDSTAKKRLFSDSDTPSFKRQSTGDQPTEQTFSSSQLTIEPKKPKLQTIKTEDDAPQHASSNLP